MTFAVAFESALQRLIAEDAVGQLRRRDGQMAVLGSEGSALKLDWVEALARLLDDPAGPASVEEEARAIRDRGMRHVIWAGMGGSVLTVRVLRDLGFCAGEDGVNAGQRREGALTIHPLDSTDPAALNAIVRAIASAKGLPTPAGPEEDVTQAYLRSLLNDVLMVGVSMGMTSEEPITHLTWFGELLERADLPTSEHILVMTLPGSYLDTFAHERHAPSCPLQLDGGSGTGGRMSAPSTRVFLLPAALAVTAPGAEVGQLRAVLHRAWEAYDLELAARDPARHPFVRLAAALSAASKEGVCRLLLDMPQGWSVFVPWLEQLLEESLGKGSKGVVVFGQQTLDEAAIEYRDDDMLRVRVVTDTSAPMGTHERTFILSQPTLGATEPRDRLAALAASCLGWQLSMALFGYLQGIHFAGQPAVEDYKARARVLREQVEPLEIASRWRPAVTDGPITLFAPRGALIEGEAEQFSPAGVFASALRDALARQDQDGQSKANRLGYVDVTVNGVAPAAAWSVLEQRASTIANLRLGVPLKLRQAPAAYHSTEQSEMDGPPYMMSLRVVARKTEALMLGTYTTRFLHAQAVSTWQAMLEAGRMCYLMVIDGSLEDAQMPLVGFFAELERRLDRVSRTDAP